MRKYSGLQIDRFKETARTLGADEDEATFKAKLAAIAKHRPAGEPPAVPKPEKPD